MNDDAINGIKIIVHSRSALRLRLFRPGLVQLKRLLDEQSTWAQGRTVGELRDILSSSSAVVSAWNGDKLIGFGRACSDGHFRGVLWDVIVDQSYRKHGVGRRIVEQLTNHPKLARVERIYLMTSQSAAFYSHIGFSECTAQALMWINRGG